MKKQTSRNAGHVGQRAAAAPMEHGSGGGHYGRFAWMLVLSFVAMYVLMRDRAHEGFARLPGLPMPQWNPG